MTDMTAPVSVVIPCYLCKDTIKRAVLSVLSQSLLPSEILLVDDASPDGGETVLELERLKDQYGDTVPVRIVHSERNEGPGSARNRGWDVATQPYVAFLDADDAWCSRKIEIQYAWMQDHPAYKLTCHCYVQSVSINTNSLDVSANLERILYNPIKVGTLLYSNAFATRTVMIRRDLPFRFKEGKRYAEDYLLWLDMIINGVCAAKIEIPLAVAFKGDFGDGGLSANLLKMELGELDCYRQLYKKRLIAFPLLIAVASYSVIKFLRRIVIVILR